MPFGWVLTLTPYFLMGIFLISVLHTRPVQELDWGVGQGHIKQRLFTALKVPRQCSRVVVIQHVGGKVESWEMEVNDGKVESCII
jgi:hypothetical protein